MNNPLTKEELQQMVKDAGKPVVVWLDYPESKERDAYAMFDGVAFIKNYGVHDTFARYLNGVFGVYLDKPVEPPALTDDEQATLRYICKVYPHVRYINRGTGCLLLQDNVAVTGSLPTELFKAIPKETCWEILIGEDGTVTLEAAKNETD